MSLKLIFCIIQGDSEVPKKYQFIALRTLKEKENNPVNTGPEMQYFLAEV